jgi:hypothetical protein
MKKKVDSKVVYRLLVHSIPFIFPIYQRLIQNASIFSSGVPGRIPFPVARHMLLLANDVVRHLLDIYGRA